MSSHNPVSEIIKEKEKQLQLRFEMDKMQQNIQLISELDSIMEQQKEELINALEP